MNRLRRRARSGFSKGKQSSVVKYLKEISGYPLSVSNFLSLVELTISGNAVQSNLPSGYTEVGYIESSGTQYIDTGVCPTNNTKVEGVFSADKNSVFVYGSRTQGNANANHSFCIEGAGVGYFQFGTSLVASSQVISFNSKHTVIISQDGGYFNGELKQSYDTMSFESTVSMYLCGLNYSDSVDSRMFDGKIYSFRVWESGELIQSLVPCKRDSDGAVGMYDTVTGAFLTNSGTGVFTAGAAVTPTPDTPVDIQLCGDATGNLLDYDVFDNMPEYTSSSSNIGSFAVPLPNGVYTASTNIPLAPYAGMFVASSMPSDKWTTASHGVSAGMPRTVTVTDGVMYIGLYWRNVYDVAYDHVFTKEDFTTGMYWIMLTTGSEAQSYEPYGYKVSGRVEGVNLFNKDDVTLGYRLTENGAVHNSDSAGKNSFVSNYISVDPNTIYSLNYVITVSEITYERACFYDTDKQYISKANAGARTFTTPQNASYVRLCRLQTHLDDTMLLKGAYTSDTIPPYEPYQPPQDFAVYLPQQIAKVGDVADTVVVDFEKRTATLTKQNGYMVFNGTESWGKNASSSQDRYDFRNSVFANSYNNDYAVISNKYKSLYSSNNDKNVLLSSSFRGISVFDSDYKTVEEFKQGLSSQYADGDPTYAHFWLATPVTTDITAMQDWDAMPELWEGSVIITSESDIEPSNLNLKYYSSVE